MKRETVNNICQMLFDSLNKRIERLESLMEDEIEKEYESGISNNRWGDGEESLK